MTVAFIVNHDHRSSPHLNIRDIRVIRSYPDVFLRCYFLETIDPRSC